MTAEDLLNSLFQEVPEIREAVDMMLHAYSVNLSEGRFPVWEYGVMEVVKFLLEESSTYCQPLTRVFAFFEKMASGDEDTRNFFLVATMDYFYEHQNLLSIANKFMGPSTKAAWQAWYQFQKDSLLFELSQLYSDKELEAMKQM